MGLAIQEDIKELRMMVLDTVCRCAREKREPKWEKTVSSHFNMYIQNGAQEQLSCLNIIFHLSCTIYYRWLVRTFIQAPKESMSSQSNKDPCLCVSEASSRSQVQIQFSEQRIRYRLRRINNSTTPRLKANPTSAPSQAQLGPQGT